MQVDRAEIRRQLGWELVTKGREMEANHSATQSASARMVELEAILKQTQADQGGDATWEVWLAATAEDAEEFMHEEACELLSLKAAVSLHGV